MWDTAEALGSARSRAAFDLLAEAADVKRVNRVRQLCRDRYGFDEAIVAARADGDDDRPVWDYDPFARVNRESRQPRTRSADLRPILADSPASTNGGPHAQWVASNSTHPPVIS